MDPTFGRTSASTLVKLMCPKALVVKEAVQVSVVQGIEESVSVVQLNLDFS